MSPLALPRALLALCLLLAPGLATAGERVEVRIYGLAPALKENVRALLSLERQKASPRLNRELLERLFEQAPEEIRRALEPFGHYRPTIDSALRPPQDGGPWGAVLRVDPGPPVPMARVDIGLEGPGREDPDLLALAAGLPVRQGEPLDHALYERAKTELVQGAQRLGYLDASLAARRIELDLEAYQARVEIRLATGPLFRFGPVSFEQSEFDEAYLRGFVPFREGEPFRAEGLSELRGALSRSGHFQQVEIERLPPSAEVPQAVPVRVGLTPFKPNRYRARVGWGTDTGFGLHLDWTRRYIGGRGHHFDLGTVLVQERAKLVGDLSYFIPLDPLERSFLSLSARHQGKDLSYDDLELEEGDKTRILNNTLGVGRTRPRALWGRMELEESLGVSYLTESYDLFDVLFGNQPQAVQDIIEGLIGEEERAVMAPSFKGLVPSATWTLRRGDDPLYTRDGEYARVELRGAKSGLASNFTFWQARLRTVFIRPLFEADRLILRGDLAYSGVDSKEALGITFNQMPELFEFRTGGDRSVRGYGYETLLPEDSATGGRHLLVASVEYEREIIPDWSAAAFFDAGNALNRLEDFKLKQAVGIGGRWRSPVGQVRLDLAVPLGDADDSFRVHLTIGPEF